MQDAYFTALCKVEAEVSEKEDLGKKDEKGVSVCNLIYPGLR